MLYDLDPYAALEVAPTASQAALKAAHRRLVRRHHPDLQPPAARAEATRRVQEINVAYGLVRDPQTRARYDRLRRLRTPGRSLGRRVAEVDADLARQWDELLRAAGRWGARWWRRNRRPLRAAAGTATKRARRLGAETVGRLLWLLSCAAWTGIGILVAEAAHRLAGSSGLITPLVGAAVGCATGARAGWRLRLRMAGLPLPSRHTALTVLAWVAAIATGLWLD